MGVLGAMRVSERPLVSKDPCLRYLEPQGKLRSPVETRGVSGLGRVSVQGFKTGGHGSWYASEVVYGLACAVLPPMLTACWGP